MTTCTYVIINLGLKLGRVTWVTFCAGQPDYKVRLDLALTVLLARVIKSFGIHFESACRAANCFAT